MELFKTHHEISFALHINGFFIKKQKKSVKNTISYLKQYLKIIQLRKTSLSGKREIEYQINMNKLKWSDSVSEEIKKKVEALTERSRNKNLTGQELFVCKTGREQ